MTKYLSAEDILKIHSLIVEGTGGTHGVREINLLTSLVERPKATFGGSELHTGLFQKAAVLCEALVNYHVFVDGNKRTAFVTMARFLILNEYSLDVTNSEIEETMISIAEKKIDVDALSEWIETHSKDAQAR